MTLFRWIIFAVLAVELIVAIVYAWKWFSLSLMIR